MDGDAWYDATEATHLAVDAYWGTQGRTQTFGFIGQRPGFACDAWAMLPVWTRDSGILRTQGLSGPLDIGADGTPSGGEGFELYLEAPAWAERDIRDFTREWWHTALARVMTSWAGRGMRATIEHYGLLTMAVPFTDFPETQHASLEGWVGEDGAATVAIGTLDTARDGRTIDVGWQREAVYAVTPLLPAETAFLRRGGDRDELRGALRRGPTRHWAVEQRAAVVRL